MFSSFVKAPVVHLESLAEGSYSFYSTDKIESVYFTNVIDLGFSYIYECDSCDAGKVRPLFTRIDGESIAVDNIGTSKILRALGGHVVSQSDFGIYAYSARIASYIIEDNRKINIQIAYSDDRIIIGWPVILGSY